MITSLFSDQSIPSYNLRNCVVDPRWVHRVHRGIFQIFQIFFCHIWTVRVVGVRTGAIQFFTGTYIHWQLLVFGYLSFFKVWMEPTRERVRILRSVNATAVSFILRRFTDCGRLDILLHRTRALSLSA